MTTTLLLLTVGAVWRVSRLLAVDYLTEPWRIWAERKHPMLGYLATCPWCISIWVAGPFVAAALLWPTNRAVFGIMLALTASGVAGFLATIEDRLDRP